MISSGTIGRWPIIGNGHVIDFLSKSIALGRIAHSYIFYGPEDVGKSRLAFFFAQILLCAGEKEKPCGACPSCRQFDRFFAAHFGKDGQADAAGEPASGDLAVIKKAADKKNITIEQVRELISRLSMSSFLNGHKIGIIKDAHLLSEDAANALLKTLEEPSGRAVVILTTSHPELLPGTIISRSQVLRLRPAPYEEIYDLLLRLGADRSEAQNISRLALGRPALAVKFYENKDFYSAYLDKAREMLDNLNKNAAEKIMYAEGLCKKAGEASGGGQALADLEIFESLARDFILFQLGQKDLMKHWAIMNEIEKAAGGKSLDFLADLSDRIKEAKVYIKANVSPELAIGNLLVGLP